MNQKLVFGIVIFIIVVGGVGVYTSSNPESEMIEKKVMMQEEKDSMVAKENLAMEQQKEAMVTKEEGMVKPGEAMMQKEDSAMVAKVGSYEVYSPEKIAMVETKDVVLFFHASWCPSCRALNSDIEKNVGAIPSGLTILKTDYDKETELKKKYGVTTQHTLVQVDKDGNLIKKWSGGSKLENLISQVQ